MKARIENMTADQLVDRFTSVALNQDEALLDNDTARFNRLYGEMDDIKSELKSRAGDQRRALLVLYDHPNAQVRLKAAIATLALEPERARAALVHVREYDDGSQALDAGMTLLSLDRGEFKPT
jgi:hypothetical protein